MSSDVEEAPALPAASSRTRTALILFVLTCASVYWVGGAAFAVPFLTILVCHELGHYVAARIHGIDASLPYFLPLPMPPIGTLGAVIGMREPIQRRDALFDVGASGPIAGLVVAIPVLIYGLITSEVKPIVPGEGLAEGHSLLYAALLYCIKGPIPHGHDIMLNSTAFAGWAGLLVTMMNLVPVGQLDGGHVAYALFGPKQDELSSQLRYALFAFGGAMVGYGAWEARDAASAAPVMMASANWLIWAIVLTVMARGFGAQHPPTDDKPLDPRRKALAWFCLLLFALLFTPRWLVPMM
jgi:membrane-associated protease RseP (regulator of RpoE activity)